MSEQPPKSESTALRLRRENGKVITCDLRGEDTVALIVWSKNDIPKCPLDLTLNEAKGLARLLQKAIDASLSEEVKDGWIEYRGRDDAALSEEVKGGEL